MQKYKGKHKGAYYVSLLFGLPWIVALIAVILLKGNVNIEQAVPLALTALIFHILIPMSYFVWARQTGRISDLDITDRKERYSILTLTIVSFLVSLYITKMIGNTIVFHMLAIIIVYLTIAYLITFYWKISLHMGINMMSVILINYFYDWKVLYLFLAIPLIFWSRRVLHKHTISQLLLGGTVSAGVALGGLKMFGYI